MHRNISVIGLGYVGLPVAVAFGQQQAVVALDINPRRIEQLKAGYDASESVDSKTLQKAQLTLTTNPSNLSRSNFHIVAVPTPINHAKQPDLSALLNASSLLGAQLKEGDIVIYESTVYPGATEEQCVPVLEKRSGLVCGHDFFVGYSPERINPGDKAHSFTQINKVVSAQTKEVLAIITDVYGSVVQANIYQAPSIKVAEAAKVIENAQRDINIAFVNELKVIFDKMNIDVYQVLAAASTKWNFLPFKPGLVGGHCIGVDPYYLTYKAQQLGYHPEVILSGRRINDGMGQYIATMTVKQMIKKAIAVKGTKVGILGFTFKENCPDVRNTKVMDIVKELASYDIEPIVYDPWADRQEAKHHYAIHLSTFEDLSPLKVFIIAVTHDEFLEPQLAHLLADSLLVIDVKNFLPSIMNYAHPPEGNKQTF